jgi:3-mercaptopyruvate sulfurtransferase SseA
MSEYKPPEVLVSTYWVAQNLNAPGFRLVEVDVDTTSYEKGHIPGAIAWNWQTQLQAATPRSGTTTGPGPSGAIWSGHPS